MRTTILALLLVAGPAEAGMRALYHAEAEPKALEIETGDNGDLRIGKPGDPAYGLEVGGMFHLVSPGPDGKVQVVRVDDLAAVIGKALPPLFARLFTEAARAHPSPPPRMQRTGTRTVAGFPGEVWKITLSGDPPQVQEMVFSPDPALKPVGRAIGRFMESMMVMVAPLMGEMATDIVSEMRSVHALGTPLESVGRFRLVKAEAATIPADRLLLPAAPLSRAEIEKQAAAGTPPAR
jgi:hypothetical protein